MVRIPRVLIAGTHSGVGKTTVTLGLMAALKHRDLAVQPFKVGPDYLDPSHHTRVSGRMCRNLDTWLLRPRAVAAVFQHASADAALAIVEGVMGLFDGHASTSERGSTAELAKQLQIPVILVVDGSRMARSAAALTLGYLTFDRNLPIAGVIFNKVREPHYKLLHQAMRQVTGCPVLGYLPPDPRLTIPERYLGLVPAQEERPVNQLTQRLADVVSRSIDVDRLLRIARRAAPLSEEPLHSERNRPTSRCRIGVARDQAFHFYYQENLELLRHYGAELVEFSPLADARLPEALDALYLGGGFPEVFAQPLASNVPLRSEIKAAVAAGLPTYAECGGLMYLAKQLTDQRGRRHTMVGALPGTIRMTNRLQHFGYVTVSPARDTILAKKRDASRGHEFHYSTWTYPVSEERAAYVAVKGRRGWHKRFEGFASGNVLASYVHVHFLTNPRWAKGFVTSAQRWNGQHQPSPWRS